MDNFNNGTEENFEDDDGNDVVDGNKPEEIDVAADDTEYRLQSVPDKPSDYVVSDDITQAENFDEQLLDEFRKISHSEKLTQSQLTKTIQWWNRHVKEGSESDFGQSFIDGFLGFAGRNHFTESQVAGLQKWFNTYMEKTRKQISRIREHSRKAGGRSSSDSRAAQIAKLLKSPHYISKADSAAHKKIIRQLNELYQQGGRR